MLIITDIEELYLIAYFPPQHKERLIFFFRKDFLSEKTLRNIRTLPFFKKRASYPLDENQQQAITEIFAKIIGEQTSGYIFSEDLQRTYLMELIHFIIKVHQAILKSFV
jgi:hypothetical protein